MLDCYIINLGAAKDRWEATSKSFSSQGMNVIRVPAITGKELTFPHPNFAGWRYFFYYGRPRVSNKVACYFSHIKALQMFLETDKEHAMICEDDVFPMPELMDILHEAMRYSTSWDFLRLNGIKPTHGLNFTALPHGYHMCCDLKTASGNGAKIVNRFAAETIVKKCRTMCLPHDVTLFYDWSNGIREVTVQPFPIKLNESASNNSTITGNEPRYPLCHPATLRHFISLPYRLVSRGSRKITRVIWALQNYCFPPAPK